MENPDIVTELITIDESDNEVLKPEKEVLPGVIKELQKNELIKKYGSLDAYLAIKLLGVMEEAMAPDNKGNLHIDYRTRLKTFELLLKLQNEKFGQSNIHLNFFASPKKLRH